MIKFSKEKVVLSDRMLGQLNSFSRHPCLLSKRWGRKTGDIGVAMNTYTHPGLEDALEEAGWMQELENARKKQEKQAGKKGETKVSKRMFRAG